MHNYKYDKALNFIVLTVHPLVSVFHKVRVYKVWQYMQ